MPRKTAPLPPTLEEILKAVFKNGPEYIFVLLASILLKTAKTQRHKGLSAKNGGFSWETT